MFDHYADIEYLLAKIQLVMFMLGMGATLRPHDFIHILLRPQFLIVGGACQLILTPCLALLINRWWNLDAGIALGLILVSTMPGGQMSKLFTYMARGNVALSITLTACGTLGSLVTVPLLLQLLATDYLGPNSIEMPVSRVVGDVALYLLLPLLVGMAVSRIAPARRLAFSKVCIRIGLVFVAAMIAGSFGSGRIQPAAYGWSAPTAIIFFCLAAMQLSMLPFRIFGWPKPDAVAVGIEATMRNMNLALLLKALVFPEADAVANAVLFVILFYGGTALVAGLPLAWRYRRMAARMAMEQAQQATVPSSFSP